MCSHCVFRSWSWSIICQCSSGFSWRWTALSCRAPHPFPTSCHPTPTTPFPWRFKATSWVIFTGWRGKQLNTFLLHENHLLQFKCNIKILLSYRPVSYSVNQQHPGQVLVQAHVVPLALEVSTTLLVLRPSPTLLAQSGYRSSVTLRNQRNHAAEFTWKPVVTESGILFSIRPATGTTSTAQF